MSSVHPKCIVFCIEALTIGGAEQMLVAMANQFVQRHWQVHMVCLAKPGELADKLDENISLHILNKKPGIDLSLPKRLRALISEINPVAVNSHLFTANLWTRISLLRSGIPVVVTEHSRDTWKPFHYRFIDRRLAATTRKLVAVSHDTAQFYRDDINIRADLITVINNGVDTKAYAQGTGETLKQQWAPNKELLIGTVGRLVPAKNQMRLLDVAAELREMVHAFKVVIVGEGELFDTINARVRELNLQAHIILAGARQDIPNVLAALDIFVLTSDREGHPLTALEAQAAGTPVVLTNAGGSADAVASNGEQRGGLLVEKDYLAVTDAIKYLANNGEAREKMGAFAQQHALAHFDMQHMVDKYEALFT
jgi:glycosyltransferase involved in cell wall biosynthesis